MTSGILFVETNKILTSTFRVERSIQEDGVLLELKNNIKNYGIKIPLIVTLTEQNSYKLIDGHRRLKVAIALEMETVPCIIENSDNVMEIALSVNIHREDLTSVEIGNLLLDIYNKEKAKNPKFTQAKLANIVNKSKAYISQHIKYVTLLDSSIQKDILDNKRFIDKNILTRISKLDNETQISVYKEVLENKLNKEDVQKLITELTKNDSIAEMNNIVNIEIKEDSSLIETDKNSINNKSEKDNSNIKTNEHIVNIEIKEDRSTIETDNNSTNNESEKDSIFISNMYIEFKLKSDLLDENVKKEFKNELFHLLTKYDLYKGLTC